ncbi:hypothetical protein SAMN05216312_102655 [Cohnella sp. OV330]|uniref:permease n=1 Tax=Cohnella sp. OV330 TaxID=1855288 RepID=UPI0008DEBB82|nr:permease [Cohnella sp. OV330]SFA98204.1 hypothetical protein SAMN05216312_102655 [Cohnella sp. OV330]
MFAGHFGLAAAVKGRTSSRVPLWALMLATQLLDILFVPLLLAGAEKIEEIPGKESYGGALIHADYTHSLAGALLVAAIAGWLAGRRWGKNGGWTIGAVVFSHWLLDLIVHRPDLPILPANAGGLPLLGLGMWHYPAVCAGVEALILVVGAIFYIRSLPRSSVNRPGARSVAAGAAMVLTLAASLATDLLGA